MLAGFTLPSHEDEENVSRRAIVRTGSSGKNILRKGDRARREWCAKPRFWQVSILYISSPNRYIEADIFSDSLSTLCDRPAITHSSNPGSTFACTTNPPPYTSNTRHEARNLVTPCIFCLVFSRTSCRSPPVPRSQPLSTSSQNPCFEN